MAQLIRHGDTKIITKEGEVHISISLDLNINLNSDGKMNITAQAQTTPKPVENKSDDTNWAVPDFTSGVGKVKFGKSE